MRDAVTFYNASLRGFPRVADLLVPLSGVLRAHPDVHLTQLAWEATDDAKATPKIRPIAPREAPPVKAVAKSAQPGQVQSQSSEENANPPFTGGRYQIALVEATVHVPNNDFRGAMAEVERLAADIGQVPGFRADVMESPLDTSPGTGLQARYADKEGATMDARFVLRIVREGASPA